MSLAPEATHKLAQRIGRRIDTSGLIERQSLEARTSRSGAR
jgi:hypothetical protein